MGMLFLIHYLILYEDASLKMFLRNYHSLTSYDCLPLFRYQNGLCLHLPFVDDGHPSAQKVQIYARISIFKKFVKTNVVNTCFHQFFSFNASFIANLSAFIDDAQPQARQSCFGVACPWRFLDKFKFLRAFIDHSWFDNFFFV